MAAIDPTTRDLVLEADGRLGVPADPIAAAVDLRISTHRGSCFWDPAFGSTLHELAQAKIGASFQQDLESRIRVALKPMVDDGRLADIAFEHSRSEANRWDVRVVCLTAARTPIVATTWIEVS